MWGSSTADVTTGDKTLCIVPACGEELAYAKGETLSGSITFEAEISEKTLNILSNVSSFTGLKVGMSVSDELGAILERTNISELKVGESKIRISKKASKSIKKEKIKASSSSAYFVSQRPGEIYNKIKVIIEKKGKEKPFTVSTKLEGKERIITIGLATNSTEEVTTNYTELIQNVNLYKKGNPTLEQENARARFWVEAYYP